MLLHIREIGLSQQKFGCHGSHHLPFYKNFTFRDFNGNKCSWKSLLLHEPAQKFVALASSKSMLNKKHNRLQDHDVKQENNEYAEEEKKQECFNCAYSFYGTGYNSQWNCLQYSLPTYYCNRNCYENNAYNSSNNNTNVCSYKKHFEDDKMITNSPSMRINNTITTNIQLRRTQWRPYTRQTSSMPFSKLKTPVTDAILALDRWGGYLIGIGGDSGIAGGAGSDGGGINCSKYRSGESCRPFLSIRFYGEFSHFICLPQ